MGSMHNWSDKSFDWDGLYAAGVFIEKGLRRYLIPVRQQKEKFGQIRVYCDLGWTSLHSIFYPQCAYIRFKKGGLLWHLEYSKMLMNALHVVNWAVVPFHKWAYRHVYKKAVAKWPHLAEELTDACDYPNLLKGIRRSNRDA